MINTAAMSRRRYSVILFILLCFLRCMLSFHRSAVGVVAVDMMNDLKVDAALLGLLSAGYFYPYAIMQIPIGLLSDSQGARKTITIFLSIAALGSLLFGISKSPSGVLFGRILVGIGVSTIYVCTLKLISQWYHGDNFATMNSLLVSIGAIGLLISTVPLAWLSDLYGWRMPFIMTSAITVVLIVFVWLCIHDSPESRNNNKKNVTLHSRPPLKKSIFTILSSKRFWPPCIWLMCSFSLYIAFGGLWAAPYFMHVYGLTKIEASRILMMIAFGMIIGSPLIGILSDKIVKRRKPIHIASSTLLVITILIFVLFVDSIPLPILYLLVFCFGIFAVSVMPVGFASIKDLFPKEMAGTASGIANLFPFILGAILQPLMGYILENVGKNGDIYTATAYQYAITVLLICAIVAMISSFFITETSSHHKKQESNKLP